MRGSLSEVVAQPPGRGMMSREVWTHIPSRARGTLLTLGLLVFCAGIGAMIARGGTPERIALGLAGVVPLLLPIASLRFRILTVWIVLTVVGSPFLHYPQQHPLLTLDRIWVLGGGVVYLVTSVPRLAATSTSRVLVRSFVGFAAFYGVRTLVSGRTGLHGISAWTDPILIPAILFVIAFRNVRTRAHCEKLAKSFAVVGAILGLLAIIERVTGFELATLSGGSLFRDPAVGFRVSGTFATPDELALCLLISFAMTLYLAQLHRSRRGLWITIALIELAGLALTFFRGAWIAALLIVIIEVGFRPRRYERLIGVTVVVLALTAAVFFESYGTVAQRITNTGTASQRLATYRASLQLFKASPLYGVGVSSFTVSSQNFQQSADVAQVGGVAAVPYAHNSYLLVLVEQGVLGFVAFLALSFAAGRGALRLLRTSSARADVYFGLAVAGSLCGYLLMSMELAEITTSTTNAFIAILLGAAAGRIDTTAGVKDRRRVGTNDP